MEDVDDAMLGELAPTVGYWRVLSLVELGRVEEAREAHRQLKRRYPKSGAADSASALIEQSAGER